eukprot:TRINITY_DN22798_c0_g1_i1.p1 TRINITY_DN22798_c0_g1~~TRINITY_DN22798_c0_g1_i1.p1  ORF type:complete len:187 (+),score=33.38 TRINITY_DN22798_c0_g1_i1:192-752(+)
MPGLKRTRAQEKNGSNEVEDAPPAKKDYRYYYYQFGQDLEEGPTRITILLDGTQDPPEKAECNTKSSPSPINGLVRTATTVMSRAPSWDSPSVEAKATVFYNGDAKGLAARHLRQLRGVIETTGGKEEELTCYRLRYCGQYFSVATHSGSGGMVSDEGGEVVATLTRGSWKPSEDKYEFIKDVELV